MHLTIGSTIPGFVSFSIFSSSPSSRRILVFYPYVLHINTPASGFDETSQIGPFPPLRLVCVLVRQPRPTSRSLIPFRVLITSTSASPKLAIAIASSPPRSHRAFSSIRERGLGPLTSTFHIISELIRRLSTYIIILYDSDCPIDF